MAKFLYSMQNVLDIKERLETQAKTEYAEMNSEEAEDATEADTEAATEADTEAATEAE